MARVEGGIWEAFVPGLNRYDAYQYAIHKADGSGFVTRRPSMWYSSSQNMAEENKKERTSGRPKSNTSVPHSLCSPFRGSAYS